MQPEPTIHLGAYVGARRHVPAPTKIAPLCRAKLGSATKAGITNNRAQVNCAACLRMMEGTGPVKIELAWPWNILVPALLQSWERLAKKALKIK